MPGVETQSAGGTHAPFHSLTSVEAIELIKRLAGHTDHEIAAELNVSQSRFSSWTKLVTDLRLPGTAE